MAAERAKRLLFKICHLLERADCSRSLYIRVFEPNPQNRTFTASDLEKGKLGNPGDA